VSSERADVGYVAAGLQEAREEGGAELIQGRKILNLQTRVRFPVALPTLFILLIRDAFLKSLSPVKLQPTEPSLPVDLDLLGLLACGDFG
jgi:hypothetical protein